MNNKKIELNITNEEEIRDSDSEGQISLEL